MTKDEKFYRARSFNQTNAIEAIDAILTFTGLTSDEMRQEIAKAIAECKEQNAALIRANIDVTRTA